jgi:hypothetical protein
VHIDPDEMDVAIYRRTDSGDWDIERLDRASRTIRIAGTDVAITLAAVYEGVPVIRLPEEM